MAGVPEWAKPIEQPTTVPEWAKPVGPEPVANEMMVAGSGVQREEGESSTILNALNRRIGKTKAMYERTTDKIDSPYSFMKEAPKIPVLAAGQVFGAGLDVIADATGKVVSAATPEPVKEWGREAIGTFLQTDAGRAGLNALKKGSDAWAGFAKENPDEAMMLETIFNVSAFGATKKAAGAVEKEVLDIGADAWQYASKMNPNIADKAMLREVRKGMLKGARPGVEGKRTFSQAEGYYKKAKSAVEAIIENKGALRLTDDFGDVVTGKLPENLPQFSQAISQAKNTIYNKYDDLAKQTTGQVIDTADIVSELRKTAANKSAKVASPYAARHAELMADRLEDAGKLTATEAQEIVQDFNIMLSAYYQNPNRTSAVKNVIDASVANHLRKKLDDAIGAATGVEYQSLKNQYGALKAIERDVNRRMVVDGRKEVKGLLDYSNLFSSAEMVRAVLTQSGSGMAAAATTKGIAAWYKKLKDPNKAIKQMFKNSETIYTKKLEFTPQSKAGQAVQQMNAGMQKVQQLRATPINPLNP